jgi:hypothetical protein
MLGISYWSLPCHLSALLVMGNKRRRHCCCHILLEKSTGDGLALQGLDCVRILSILEMCCWGHSGGHELNLLPADRDIYRSFCLKAVVESCRGVPVDF